LDLLSTWTNTWGLAPALLLGRLVAPTLLLGRSMAPTLLHRSHLPAAVLSGLARGKVPGKRAAEDVGLGVLAGVEARETHEEDEDHGTREGEWQMVAKKAAKSAATHTQCSSGLRCCSWVWSARRTLRRMR
jgi:hypothetical protein